MHRKNVFKLAAFILVFLVLLYGVNRCFQPGEEVRNEKASFYEEPENSLDVIFCGSSSMLRDVSPMELYRDYGIAGYSMASVLQVPSATAFTVKEALRYQTPKVIVLNMESAAIAYDYEAREAFIHSALDPYRFSLDKLQAILDVTAHDESQSLADYLLPVVRYHDSWSEYGAFATLEQKWSYLKGYVGMGTYEAVEPEEAYMQYSGEASILYEDSMAHYREAIETAQNAGVEVLLVKLPRMTWTLEEHDALAEFAEEMGISFLDFNTPELWEATGLKLETDFYDPNHLCHTGAVKLTKVLGEYLLEHYDLPDVRGAEGYESWEQALKFYDLHWNVG